MDVAFDEAVAFIAAKAAQIDFSKPSSCAEDSLVFALLRMLDVWKSDGREGGVELAMEVDRLLNHLKNKEDPAIAPMGMMARTTLKMGLSLFTRMKEGRDDAESAE